MMQRRLVMIRHAKSSWANPLQSDFERPLNERGKAEAQEMGKKLMQAGIVPDLIISSSAKRTRQTAKRIASEVGYEPDRIQWEEKLYHCIPSVFEEMIGEVGDEVQTLFIVAHNPGITDFVNSQSAGFRIDNMPTCGVVCIATEAGDWGSYEGASHVVFLFEYPGK